MKHDFADALVRERSIPARIGKMSAVFSPPLYRAVPQDCILQGIGEVAALGFAEALPITNRRYGKLQVCTTTTADEAKPSCIHKSKRS